MKKNPIIDAILSLPAADLAPVVRAASDEIVAELASKIPPEALYEAYGRVHMTQAEGGGVATEPKKTGRGRPKGSKNRSANGVAETNGAGATDERQMTVPGTDETAETSTESSNGNEEDASKGDFDPLAGELLKDYVWKLLYTSEKEEVGALVKKCMKLKISGVTEEYIRQLIGGWTTQGSLRAQQKSGATYYLLSIGAIKEMEEARKREEAASTSA